MSDKIEKRWKELQYAPGSIKDRANKDNTTLEEAAAEAEVIVLVDVSSSMSWDASNGNSRYDMAMDTLLKLQEKYEGKILLISFGGEYAQWDPHDTRGAEYRFDGLLPPPSGSTPMHLGLSLALPFDGLMDVVLVSDGEPNDENLAMQEAYKFKSPLHTIFVGPEGSEGAAFLARLSSLLGGTHSAGEDAAFNFLSERVTKLLGSSK